MYSELVVWQYNLYRSPARTQFLNVIESIFSDKSRAIIHNSNYQSVDEASNAYFREHPQCAGRHDLDQGAATGRFLGIQ
jgi:hypothetical protein